MDRRTGPQPPRSVARRIRAALAHVPAERPVVAPDCGMTYLPRASAFARPQAMVAGAPMVRRGLRLAPAPARRTIAGQVSRDHLYSHCR